ncbi:MAG: MgtC/SapB family protein [Clostridium sp.]|uniref:MgtC/SapB family protein n=1 Tax=Clostridium sp. TaxID=1506 RepID=UPI003F40D3DB
MEQALDFFLRIIIAGILAGFIGLEREMNSKEAGFRTHFLVGVGSALLMVVSKYGFSDVLYSTGFKLDPSRVAAQVVSGISFLGAGTIFLEKKVVKGLTTAAGIWTTAAIGLAVGAGMYLVGILSTFIVLIVLEVLQRLSRLHFLKAFDVTIKLSSYPDEEIMNILSDANFSISRLKTDKCMEESGCVYCIEFVIKTKERIATTEIANKIYTVDNVISVDIENV